MEIITYVRKGAITHRDDLGNLGRTEAGDVQVMSAGTGITHSEYNLEQAATELFQIWIRPDARGHQPGWGTRSFPRTGQTRDFVVLASGFAEDTEALPIHSKARLLGAALKAGESADYALGAHRHGYLVPASGSIEIEGITVRARDGAAISKLDRLRITALEDAQIVLADVT
jgi:redox-sensitive bicupin YhaK (pirin superfamily)